jgi:general stress protein 26
MPHVWLSPTLMLVANAKIKRELWREEAQNWFSFAIRHQHHFK